MILTKEVEVTVTGKSVKRYRDLGYEVRGQDTITIKVEHLPLNSNKILDCRCEKCEQVFERNYQNINKQKDYVKGFFCFKCTRRIVDQNKDNTETIRKSRERIGESHGRWNPNKKAFAAYAYKVRRISEQVYVEHKDLINPRNFPRTLCGVPGGYQLDHKISILKGFMFGINPTVIGSLDNLDMLPWADNRLKHC